MTSMTEKFESHWELEEEQPIVEYAPGNTAKTLVTLSLLALFIAGGIFL